MSLISAFLASTTGGQSRDEFELVVIETNASEAGSIVLVVSAVVSVFLKKIKY